MNRNKIISFVKEFQVIKKLFMLSRNPELSTSAFIAFYGFSAAVYEVYITDILSAKHAHQHVFVVPFQKNRVMFR